MKMELSIYPLLPALGMCIGCRGGQWSRNLYDIKCPIRVNTFENEVFFSISIYKVFCGKSEFSDLEKAIRHLGYGINGWGSTDGEFNSFHVYLGEKSLFELLKDINRFFNPNPSIN